MKKVALTLMTAALLGACSNRDEAGTVEDSAAAAAAMEPSAAPAGGMTDTTMGGTTGTAGVTDSLRDTTGTDTSATRTP
jgi:hypothetical protein